MAPHGAAKETTRMLTVVIVIHLMIVLALIGVVLLQKSEGGGPRHGRRRRRRVFDEPRHRERAHPRNRHSGGRVFSQPACCFRFSPGWTASRARSSPRQARRRAPASPGSPLAPRGRPARYVARRRTGAGRARRTGRARRAAGSEVAAKGRVSGPSVFAGQVGISAGRMRGTGAAAGVQGPCGTDVSSKASGRGPRAGGTAAFREDGMKALDNVRHRLRFALVELSAAG